MINISIGEWPKNSGIKSYSQRVFKLEQSQEIVAVSLLLQSNVIAKYYSLNYEASAWVSQMMSWIHYLYFISSYHFPFSLTWLTSTYLHWLGHVDPQLRLPQSPFQVATHVHNVCFFFFSYKHFRKYQFSNSCECDVKTDMSCLIML